MLSIMDPVELEGLVLYRDDENPAKFYFLPEKPVIPVDEKGIPDFYFIKFIRDVSTLGDNDDLGGGYVQFRTVLTIDPDRRARVLAALSTMLQAEKANGRKPFGNTIGSTDAIAANPLWKTGTVRLETFKVGDHELVRKDTDQVPVDLAGSLGASVNLQLDGQGADIFWSAQQNFADQEIPIVIAYTLTYEARVSATMQIHATRSTVVEQIWKYAQPAPYLWVAAKVRWVKQPVTGEFTRAVFSQMAAAPGVRLIVGVEPGKLKEAIHTAVTSGAITVNINTDEAAGTSGDDASKVQDTLLKMATDILSDRVIPALFGDSNSVQQASDGGASTDEVKEIYELKLDTSDTTTSTFDIELTSTSTITRDCNPNGPIHLLLPNADALKAAFKELRLADGFFGLAKIAIGTTGINFQADGIATIHVFCRYEQIDEADPLRPSVKRYFDGQLKSDADTLHWKFDLARDAQGSHKTQYEFRTDVYYGDIVISTDWAPRNDAMLLINPTAMGAVRVALIFTARRDQVRSARVTLQYRKSTGELLSDDFELTPDAPAKTWLKATGEIVPAGTVQEYSYRVVYRLDTSEIAMPMTTSTADSLEIPGPFTKVLTWTLHPQGSFEGVSNISVDVTYDDAAHGYRVVKSAILDKLSAMMAIDIPVMDGGPEEISYTARINRANGAATPLPSGQSGPGSVWIGEVVADFLTIQILPDLIDFDKDVQLAVVELSYHDDGSGFHDSATFTFSKAQKAAQKWSVAIQNGWTRTYDADIRYIAYDRSKNSELHPRGTGDANSTNQTLILDRQAK